MENVVYILGAGFSKELGIPTMAEFIRTGRELGRTQSSLDYFNEVFKMIRDMSYLHNHANSNHLDIEEVLSLLEMQSFLDEDETPKSKLNTFINFIKDVIIHTKPRYSETLFDIESKVKMKRQQPEDGWLYKLLLDYKKNGLMSNNEWLRYIFFYLSCINATIKFVNNDERDNRIMIDCSTEMQSNIITFNYDRIIQDCSIIVDNAFKNKTEDFKTINYQFSKSVATLHGDIHGNIIGPSWNKGINLLELKSEWDKAYNYISKATIIRFIGYSLPESDTYFKYFLKSSLIKNEFLHTIQVITRDTKDECKNRYSNLFPKYINDQSFLNKYFGHYYDLYFGIKQVIDPSTRERVDLFISNDRLV